MNRTKWDDNEIYERRENDERARENARDWEERLKTINSWRRVNNNNKKKQQQQNKIHPKRASGKKGKADRLKLVSFAAFYKILELNKKINMSDKMDYYYDYHSVKCAL